MSAITLAYHFNHNTYSILISHYYILGIALQSERKKGVFKAKAFLRDVRQPQEKFFPFEYALKLPNNNFFTHKTTTQ